MAASRLGDWSNKLSAHVLNHKQKAEKTKGELVMHFPSKTVPPKLTQIAPSTGDRVLKYLSMWGTFSFKPP